VGDQAPADRAAGVEPIELLPTLRFEHEEITSPFTGKHDTTGRSGDRRHHRLRRAIPPFDLTTACVNCGQPPLFSYGVRTYLAAQVDLARDQSDRVGQPSAGTPIH